MQKLHEFHNNQNLEVLSLHVQAYAVLRRQAPSTNLLFSQQNQLLLFQRMKGKLKPRDHFLLPILQKQVVQQMRRQLMV